MNGYADRKAYEPGGICYEFQKAQGLNPSMPPPEMAGMEFGHFKNGKTHRMVTWNEVMEKRREKQAEMLYRIRELRRPCMRAVRVMAWLNCCFPYEGWHCVIDGCRGSEIHEWVRGSWGSHNPWNLCKLFPVRDPGEPLLEVLDYDRWMPLFAEQYPEKVKVPHQKGDRQYPRGIVYCWAYCHGSSVRSLSLTPDFPKEI